MDVQYNQGIKRKNIFLILFSQVIGVVGSFIVALIGVISGLSGVAGMICVIIGIAATIYPLVMMTKISGEINIMCENDGEHLMPYICAWLLGLVTLGIYYIYYLYRMQTRLRENAHRYNVVITESGGMIVLWYLLLGILFGIGPIISLAIIIKNFNKMVYGYNQYIDMEDWEDPTIAREGVLRCFDGELKGASIVMKDREVITIGRDPGKAKLVVKDSKISRLHCSVIYDADKNTFIITDYSKNGTVLGNGRKLLSGENTEVFCNTEFTLAGRLKFVVDVRNNN